MPNCFIAPLFLSCGGGGEVEVVTSQSCIAGWSAGRSKSPFCIHTILARKSNLSPERFTNPGNLFMQNRSKTISLKKSKSLISKT